MSTVNESGQPYIEIQPANPDVIYVPVYDPVWIWGPPVWYPYPRWYWPPRPAGGLFFSFGPGIQIGAYFGGGWGGWGGWGWHPGWGSRTVVVNNTFIHRYNFSTVNATTVRGNTTWSHNATHREGVPYNNAQLNQQFRGNVRQNVAPQAMPRPQQQTAAIGAAAERFGNRQIALPSTPAARGSSAFGGAE